MRVRTALLLLAWACKPPEAEPKDPGPDYTPPPNSTTTIPAPSHPDFACFSETAHDNLRDGIVDGTTFSGYDALNPTWLMYEASDANGNGLFDSISFYERDNEGRVTRYERQRAGAETVETTYDTRGNILTVVSDFGSDGIIEAIDIYTWDDENNLMSYVWDAGGDGDPDYAYEYERTEDGALISASVDADGDGDIDDYYQYTVDEVEERMVMVTIDEGNDGYIDTIITYTYADSPTIIATLSYDYGNDGTIDEILILEYDENEREVYRGEDTNADGQWEIETTTTYDSEGRMLTYTVTSDYSLEYTYTYDTLGRVVQDTLYYADGPTVLINEQSDTTYSGSCP